MKHLILLVNVVFLFSCNPSAKKQRAMVQDTISTKRITLLFAGDLMQHKEQIAAAETSDGYDYGDCFCQVKEEIGKADLAIANLELTLGGKPYGGYPGFSAPDEYMYAIRDAGFDVMLTANNHALDTGKKGLERTIRLLDSLRVYHLGTYLNSAKRETEYPLIIDKNGFRIALLNCTYATNGLKVTSPNIVNYINREEIARDIRKAAAQKPDVIIACMHWGTEYESIPDKDQIEMADWLLAQGVDHVIGNHPHVVQPMELRQNENTGKKHAVVYSLGNFISNMSARNTDGGIIFKMELSKDTTVRVEKCAYSLVWTFRPKHSGEKNHKIIPAANPGVELSPMIVNRLNIFVKGARTLFEAHNQGIKEYIF